MKLSDNTLNLLNNFSTINSGITVKAGNEISTVSAMKNIFAKAVVDETFNQEHSIYDLSEYLGAVSLFDTPDFEFNGESVNVVEGEQGDAWRANLNVNKQWNTNDKHIKPLLVNELNDPHPNQDGHEWISEEILRFIKKKNYL